MKRTIKLLTVAAMLAGFSLPALAQTKECTDEFKTATYQKWYDNRKEHQDVAYEAAKDYLATCTTEDQYTAALKRFKDAYDNMMAAQGVNKQFEDAFKSKNYAQEIALGKQIVAKDPENSTAVYIIMGTAGLGDANLLNDSLPYAKKAIEQLEAGKSPNPYDTKDKALAALNYAVARATVKSAPGDAIPYFLKAARYDSDLKKSWQIYYELNEAYDKGPGTKLTEDYKGKVGPNNTETPESKLALANLFQIVDRRIDALARAVALADAGHKADIMTELTDLYKYRNTNKTDGLNELVASVLSKPIPDVPTPLTALPAQPASTPGTGTTSGNANGNNTSTTGSTAGTKKAPH